MPISNMKFGWSACEAEGCNACPIMISKNIWHEETKVFISIQQSRYQVPYTAKNDDGEKDVEEESEEDWRLKRVGTFFHLMFAEPLLVTCQAGKQYRVHLMRARALCDMLFPWANQRRDWSKSCKQRRNSERKIRRQKKQACIMFEILAHIPPDVLKVGVEVRHNWGWCSL